MRDLSTQPSHLPPETIGRYRVEGAIGRGGMGEVYRGYDDRLDRWVALKRVRTSHESTEQIRARFQREARALSRVRHPRVIEVYDYLEEQESDWLVMELVDGESLHSVMRRGDMEPSRALEITRDIASGLAAAHDLGVVHRDLKPENVMVEASGGEIKILDFGLAKRIESADGRPLSETLSERGQILGTVRYMSPEQAMGRPLDGRSDLFSLGVILYELLSGVAPFHGENTVETLTRICTVREESLQHHVPSLPTAIAELVRQLLEKEPERRPSDAKALAQCLDHLRTGLEAGRSEAELLAALPRRDEALGDHTGETVFELSEVGIPTQATQTTRTSDPGLPSTAPRRTPRRLSKMVAAVACGAALVAGLATWWSRPQPLDVAVLPPASGSVDGSVDAALVAGAIRGSLAHRLTSLEGISLRAFDETEQLTGSAAEIARVLSVDEVVAARFDCADQVCQILLSRVAAEGGEVLWSGSVSSRADDLLRLHEAVDRNFRRGYSGRETRGGAPDLEVEAADYARYLTLFEKSFGASQPVSDEVLEALAEIQRSSPRFLEAYMLEARVSGLRFFDTQERRYRDRALEAFERARELAPGNPGPLFSLADFALDVGDLELLGSTIESLRPLAAEHPQVEALEALLLERRGETEIALDRLRQATRIQPSLRLKRYLSMMEYRRGNGDRARQLFEEILELAPYASDVRLNLANLEVMTGDPTRAVVQYRALLESSPDLGTLTNLGVAHMLLRQWPEARQAFEQAETLAPGSPVLLLNLADAEHLAGEEDSAKERYQAIVRHLHQEPNAAGGALWQGLTIKGQALAHLGEAEGAVAAAQEALRLAGDNPQVMAETATIFALVGEKTSALVSIRRALDAGVDERWFGFPWFDDLRTDSRLSERLAAPSDQSSPSVGVPDEGL